MTENMNILFNQIKTMIHSRFKDTIPTINEIYKEAESLRETFKSMYPISDDEFINIKKRLIEVISHNIDFATTLTYCDSEHDKGWYLLNKGDGFYWDRFKDYLTQKRSGIIVARLDTTTDNIINNLGNPKSPAPFQRRGLLLGDVQSGKTETYTAICNKAADAGYKVIIVLAGIMEILRIQTQERLDAEFVGLDSKYSLDNKANNTMKNKLVGVGKTKTDEHHRITRFTSVETDFSKKIIEALGLNLKDLKGTAFFVVKKNKSILNNLYEWLKDNSLNKNENYVDLPLLLIDDEADNASVNTNSEDDDPTAINAAINKILKSFKQASYLGITATPFANIFIDPDIDEDGAAKDLFPKHFITLLPVPDNYIGAKKIFKNGTEYEDPPFAKSLITIENDEQHDFYVFRHRKEIAETLTDIPPSMKEAIRYFILSTAISDKRHDENEHRSMLINVSRFTAVQDKTAELVEKYLDYVKSDIQNYAKLSLKDSLKRENIRDLQDTWNKYSLESYAGLKFEKILSNYLTKASKRILVRTVNQNNKNSLDYDNYKDTGMRVIAIGGNSLSRGLTLKGLMVSYFYRNTMMYDALLQMGRWFGYRPGYDDIFKIWIGKDAIDWYADITVAFEELKKELKQMEKQGSSPKDFGLKIRQNPGSLIVTARNKMRSGRKILCPITISGRMLETARLFDDIKKLENNNNLCTSFLQDIDEHFGHHNFCYDSYVKAYIWRDIPKDLIQEFVRQYVSHPWNLNFQSEELADYIKNNEKYLLWDVAIPSGDNRNAQYDIPLPKNHIELYGEPRQISMDGVIQEMLKVGHVRVGAGDCAKIGLDKETIQRLRNSVKQPTDKTYLIPDRNPLVLLHLLRNNNEKIQNYPEFIYAIGLGFPSGEEEKTVQYVVNSTELKKYYDYEDSFEE